VSCRATNFVRRLRGLSPSEKLVAFVLADHDDHKGGGAYPGMSTVAEEAGLHDRETASRITKRLVECRVILTNNPSKGRKPTVYRFNYARANRDCRVTVENPPTVIPESRFARSNRDSGPPPTVTHKGSNRDSPVTGRGLEGLEEGARSLMQFSQDHEDSKLQVLVPTRPVEKAIQKTAQPQRAHLEAGIYRKKIADAYFDATEAKMKPDECVREAIYAGALSLVGNRSVELKGLDHEDLARNAWERIQNGVASLLEMKNFELQSRHLVVVVTRCLTSAALKFWEGSCADANAGARQSERVVDRAGGAA
jgi:hypothetical protein